jgi:hypothetical protein
MTIRANGDFWAGTDGLGRVIPAQPIATACPSAPIAKQYLITATAASVTGGVSTPLVNGVVIKAKASNSGPVCIGASGVTSAVNGSGTGYILEAGDSVFIAVLDLAALYAIGTAGDIISVLGN